MPARKFEFSLQPRLDKEVTDRAAAVEALAAARRAQGVEEGRLEKLKGEKGELLQQIAGARDNLASTPGSSVGGDDLAAGSRHLQFLMFKTQEKQNAIDAQVTRVEEGRRVVEFRRQEVEGAHARVRGLEQMRAEQLAEFKKALAAAEEKQREDTAIQKWNREHPRE